MIVSRLLSRSVHRVNHTIVCRPQSTSPPKMPPTFVLGTMGTSPSGGSTSLSSPSQMNTLLTLASSHGLCNLDTAHAYTSGNCEVLIGSSPAAASFSIGTKAPAFAPGSLAHDTILSSCAASLAALQTEQVDVYYLHGPDAKTPHAEKCDAMNALFSRGKFRRWGVSNVSVAEVREMHAYCVERGYEPPRVYQGVYNPLHRSVEMELLPMLRELGMVFYAYSPLAGGVFAKPVDRILNPEEGERFSVMSVFGNIYLKHPRAVEGLRELAEVCESRGVGTLEATIRWFRWHCKLGEGDGVIIGASKPEQLAQSLAFVDGEKLDDELVQAFEKLWDTVKDGNPAFSY